MWQSFWGLTKEKDKGVINQNMVYAKIGVPQRHQRFHMDTIAHLSKKPNMYIYMIILKSRCQIYKARQILKA